MARKNRSLSELQNMSIKTGSGAGPKIDKAVNPAIALATGKTVKTADKKRVYINKLLPEQCQPWEYHDRSEAELNPESCEGLIKSIKNQGQMLPGRVRKTEEVIDGLPIYEIIYGRRRCYAAKQLGIHFEAEVVDSEDEDAYLAMVAENFDRQDLTPYEKMVSCEKIIKSGLVSFRKIADAVAVTKSQIGNYSDFLKGLDLAGVRERMTVPSLITIGKLGTLYSSYKNDEALLDSILADASKLPKNICNDNFLNVLIKKSKVVAKKISGKVSLKNNIEARYTISNNTVKLELSDIPPVSEMEMLVRELKKASKKQ